MAPTRTIKLKTRQSPGLKLQKARSTILLGNLLNEYKLKTFLFGFNPIKNIVDDFRTSGLIRTIIFGKIAGKLKILNDLEAFLSVPLAYG